MPKIISNERIYKAVIKLISEKSYFGTSTKLMAEAAGISEITLYRKFGTKAGVVKKAIQHIVENENIKDSFQYSGNIQADLSRIVKAYLEMVKNYGNFLFILMAEISRFGELEEILEIPLELIQNFSKLISIYQEEGVLIKEHVQSMASSLIGPLIYEGMMYNAMNNIKSFEIDSSSYVEKFLNGRLQQDIS